jgi:hypothetical protein
MFNKAKYTNLPFLVSAFIGIVFPGRNFIELFHRKVLKNPIIKKSEWMFIY